MTIGNFDGVHSGHRALVTAARSFIDNDGRLVVLAFDPHPSSILRPGDRAARLTTFEQRAELLRAAGADEVIRLVPTPDLLHMDAEAFIANLIAQHRPGVIVEGPDFRFGRGRTGTVETLKSLEGKYGYRTAIIGPVDTSLTDQHLVRVSSTMIRWLIQRGRLRDAAEMLGRPFEITGAVIPGDRRGRTIGVPTANIAHGDLLLPADGIYVGHATLPDGAEHPAAVSVGTKPTFGRHPRVCEAHLLGYDGPLDHYGWTIRLRFLDWLRDQIRYDRVEDLVAQIGRDLARVEAARAVPC